MLEMRAFSSVFLIKFVVNLGVLTPKDSIVYKCVYKYIIDVKKILFSSTNIAVPQDKSLNGGPASLCIKRELEPRFLTVNSNQKLKWSCVSNCCIIFLVSTNVIDNELKNLNLISSLENSLSYDEVSFFNLYVYLT